MNLFINVILVTVYCILAVLAAYRCREWWRDRRSLSGALSEVRHRARYRPQTDTSEPGRNLEAPVKLRSTQPGSNTRWREGFLASRSNGALTMWGRPPRPDTRIDLSGLAITGSRPTTPLERLQFAGGTVWQIDCPAGQFEIATGGGASEALARAVLGVSDDQAYEIDGVLTSSQD